MSEPSIPISAAGEQQWVRNIESVLFGLSGGHGLGVVYWEPGWIGNAGLGSACSVSSLRYNFLLFRLVLIRALNGRTRYLSTEAALRDLPLIYFEGLQ